MKTKTPKKKPVKTAKIPPPPSGWEIVGKDDPRLRKLPSRPMACYPETGEWTNSLYRAGEELAMFAGLTYALPIATQSATPQAAQSPTPMIRLRLPSEKPTREDGDAEGTIIAFGVRGVVFFPHWTHKFHKDVLAWLPGRLPDGILPREPSREERLRTEFEEKFNSKYPDGSYKEAAWQGFLAAKEGGAK
jgi:hypothetical protein